MNQDVIKYLCRLESFKTVCKNMHFSAKGVSEHKFFDELNDLLHKAQDELGEIEQGVHAKFDKKTIKSDGYSCESPKQFIQDIVIATKKVYKKLKGDDYIGMRSAIEGFLQSLDKQPYLLDMCLKEDFKRQYKQKINESVENEKMYDVTEQTIMEAVGSEVEEFFKKLNTQHPLTPNKPGDGYKMFQASNQRTPEERNPSYVAALKAAQERKAKKQMGESVRLTEKEFGLVINEALHKVLTRL